MTEYAVELSGLVGRRKAMAGMLVGLVAGAPIELDASHITGRTVVPLECEQDRAEAIVKILQAHFLPRECGIWKRAERGGWKNMRWERKTVPA